VVGPHLHRPSHGFACIQNGYNFTTAPESASFFVTTSGASPLTCCSFLQGVAISMKKHSTLFTVALAIAIITIMLGVYYLIPHVYHPFVYLHRPFQLINRPLVNYDAHEKYAVIFFGIALIALIGAFLARPKRIV